MIDLSTFDNVWSTSLPDQIVSQIEPYTLNRTTRQTLQKRLPGAVAAAFIATESGDAFLIELDVTGTIKMNFVCV